MDWRYGSLLIIGIVATLYTFWLYTAGNKGWFKSDIGKLLLSMSGIVLLFELWYLFLFFFSSVPASTRGYVRLGLFVVLTLVIVWRAVIMTKLRLVARSERTNEDS